MVYRGVYDFSLVVAGVVGHDEKGPSPRNKTRKNSNTHLDFYRFYFE